MLNNFLNSLFIILLFSIFLKIPIDIMFKKFILFPLILFIFLFVFVIISFFYLIEVHQDKLKINKCYYQDTNIYSVNEGFNPGKNGCFEKMLNLFVLKLFNQKAEYKNQVIKPFIVDDDFFIYLDQAVKEAHAVLSYGVGLNTLFEYTIADNYKKPVYALDCGLTKEELIKYNKKYTNLHFQSECIGTDKYLMYGQKSSKKIHTFGQKLQELNLNDKKVFLKLGIPEIQDYIDDILKYKDNLTGISIAIDLRSPKYIIDSIYLTEKIEKDFILVARSYVYFSTDNCMRICLTYLNKNLADKHNIYLNQYNNEGVFTIGNKNNLSKYINPLAVILKKLNLIQKIDVEKYLIEK